MDLEHLRNSILTDDQKNVGKTGRVVSILLGTYLLYDSLLKDKKSISEAFLGGALLFRGISAYCPISQALGISEENADEKKIPENINIKTNLSVMRPREEVYTFWRKLDNLPLFMKHLKQVIVHDEKNSSWIAKLPGGLTDINWQSEIVKDIPNEHIGWQSLPSSSIFHAGNVKFHDAGKYGTEVQLVFSYQAPAGLLGEGLGRLFSPLFKEWVKEDIKNFKRYMESGEIPSIESQPSGG